MRRVVSPGIFILLLAALLLCPAAPLHAQMNNPHFILRASITSDEKVQLDWVPPAGAVVEYFLVFRAELDSSALIRADESAFVQIDSVAGTVTSTVDSPPLDRSHLFAYVVRGRTAGGGEIRSSIVLVNFIGYGGNVDYIKIYTIPPDKARVGVEYTYQVGAVSSDPTAVLSYALLEAPPGMTISTTGLVTWTPAPDQVGWFRVTIGVSSDKGGKQQQRFYIRVGQGNGVVQGQVKDARSGIPIERVMVKLYQRHLDRHYEYRAITDVHGFYRIDNVDPATYLVRAVPLRPDYIGQWFDGVKYVWQATPVTVPDVDDPVGGVTTVNFNLLPSEADRPHFTVQGTVTNKQTGTPIANAWVYFVRPEFALNASRTYSDGFLDGGYDRDCFDGNNFQHMWRHALRFDGGSGWVFRTRTNSSGQYSIRLPMGFYVAMAWAVGYDPIFYDGKTDPLSADIIKVIADLTGIDFALPPYPPVPLGELSGAVTDIRNGEPVMSRMIAFREHWNDPASVTSGRTFFTETDSMGAYTFSNLPPGIYYILALPLGNYIPSFYSTSGPTIRWEEATPIRINGNSVSGIDIAVLPMYRWAFGYTWIHGSIHANAPVSGASSGLAPQGEPIEGALVFALNGSGTVSGYGVTGPDGSYLIDALAPGSYSVLVVRPGYNEVTSAPVSPTYDALLNPAAGEMTLDLTLTEADVPAAVPSGYALEQNYPNPFNPSTVITFGVPSSARVSLVVYTILGQEVVRLVDDVRQAGTYQVTWNGRDAHGRAMTSGVYLYRISAGGFTATRKMTLVK